MASNPIGAGHAVLLRQRFGAVPAAHDGSIALAVVDGKIAYVSSSLTPATDVQGSRELNGQQAVATAARDAGLAVSGLSHDATARLVGLPTPQGVRLAWETVVADTSAEPTAFQHYIDAQTGEVLVRESLVDYASDNPAWKVFPASPPLNYSSSDTREVWCWTTAAGCTRAIGSSASPQPWDVDTTTGLPTFTTIGNNSVAVENWLSADPFTVGVNPATPSPTRDYQYPWTNQWFAQSCNPATTFSSPAANDIDAARANLFAMHNRMHDWSYQLGFTETAWNLQADNFGRGGLGGDPELGNAQAGGIAGGAPGFAARDNANQITFPDGTPAITNMYLWQPIAGAFYAPCVDGDYDMSIIGHEYGHAISNRMVAGPNNGLSGPQAGAMGESWSDLMAVEYLNANGYVPLGGENRFAVGAYATRDPAAGIRNYAMNQSPLNYSDIGYDVTGPQVHADGEIWSATNFAVRSALNARYDGSYPSTNAALQASCAAGALPVTACPGNRRWIQLVFDAWLLMGAGNVSMVDARDAMLAADLVRFGGANQDLLWNAFASRGLGEGASSAGNADPDPVPSFSSAYATEGTLTLAPRDLEGVPVASAQLFVGRYEARAVPVADTDPATPLGASANLVPGSYELIVRAPGFGMHRTSATVAAGQVRVIDPSLPRNLASSAQGATASGPGVSVASLIDDTEATNWAALGAPVAGQEVTVKLAPDKPWHQIRRIQVSAHLRPPNPADPADPAQSRFSALRRFQILTCEVKQSVTCANSADYSVIYTSPADAFPAIAPRPRAPQLVMRSFAVPQTKATYVKLRVLTNQCTGTPAYAGEQDADPGANSDCTTASVQATNVRAAELQVFQK